MEVLGAEDVEQARPRQETVPGTGQPTLVDVRALDRVQHADTIAVGPYWVQGAVRPMAALVQLVRGAVGEEQGVAVDGDGRNLEVEGGIVELEDSRIWDVVAVVTGRLGVKEQLPVEEVRGREVRVQVR